jgi:DNA-binding transcriptional regulator GbsR (MarR family)
MGHEKRGKSPRATAPAARVRPLRSPEARQARFIDAMGGYYEGLGIPRIGGRILGLLISRGESVTPARISTLLGVSRASVSMNLRLMTSFGLVGKHSARGERARRYCISPTAWEAACRARVEGFERLAEAVWEGLTAADSPTARRQMREMLDWTKLQRDSNRQALERWKERGRAVTPGPTAPAATRAPSSPGRGTPQ